MKIVERVKYGIRGQGTLIKREGSGNWLFAYCVRGKEHEESTGTPDLKPARRFCRQKLDEIALDRQGAKRFLGPTIHKKLVAQLLDDLETDYRLRGVKSLNQIQSHMKPIRAHFGDWRAADVTASAVDSFIEDLLEDEVAPATVNRRTQLLAQAFRLALKRGQATAVPWIRHLPENNARQGFFEAAEFAALMAALPDDLQDFVRFGYLTGWRSGEIKALRWEWVDREGALIRLPGSNSKNGRARKVPIEGELPEVMRQCERARLIETPDGGVRIADFVFHRNGHPIVDFRKAWLSACVKAGLYHREHDEAGHEIKVPDKLFHDLRRTAVRNMVRRRVPETVAMEISGHRTRAVFDRYNITSEDDLRAAMRTATLPSMVSESPSSFRGVSGE
jgi:integrase